MKNLWDKFTDIFGENIIHPQFLLKRHLGLAVVKAKRYAKGKLIDIGCGRMPYRKELESLVE